MDSMDEENTAHNSTGIVLCKLYTEDHFLRVYFCFRLVATSPAFVFDIPAPGDTISLSHETLPTLTKRTRTGINYIHYHRQ